MTEARRPGVIRSTQEFIEASPATSPISTLSGDDDSPTASNNRENPREIRNRAEKQRRDKLNQSIYELASMVPPVVASSRKIDKTGVLRLTAHFLRSHQYVFGETIGREPTEINSTSAQALLQFFNGFLLTTTYKGIVVVVSQNVQQYLGYTELELLGQNLFTITHKDDHKTLLYQLKPRSQILGPNGELLIPDRPDGKSLVAKALADEKRRFVVRFKKHTQRSEPTQYVACVVEGSLRKSDGACRGNNRCCQMVRRARARGDNPCSSGNDVVFIGIVRPTVETFKKEQQLELFRMEYRTRHSIDGQIIQCEQRIGLVTGYMTDEVQGVNAMNFMHRDDVRWVIIALREMYDQHRLYGESCYRLMMKNGQFIYMRTRGALEVETGTKAVTSFVCTNTMMNPDEGQHLIKMMKKKFTMLVNNNQEPPQEPEVTDTNDDSIPVEDPKQLEKVILHLVTNLPSPQPDEKDHSLSPERDGPHVHLAIIPPRKERIVMGIEKIYTVIKNFNNPYIDEHVDVKRIRGSSVEATTPSHNTSHFEDAPPENTKTLPTIATITNKHYRIHTNLEDFGEIFQNLKPALPNIDETCEVKTPASFAEYIAKQPNKQTKFNFTKTEKACESVILEEPGSSFSVIGTKRSIDVSAEDDYSKKKSAQNESEEAVNGRSSPTLESFFNDAILNTQISQLDDALISLEDTIDPFPDLLISQDVQDILGGLDPDEQPEPN
ncbi:neuronal PAS domain-containing protein 2-like isoform X2 [Cydia pomonella]|uniref:neuronal PAS domain-containing protein 2-like isoform X2 n=1 Tax=Cydia pomonella TaxID=82600 RepID=UPI002ADD638F|nr:neuronal PAS domain-containing protein 2-like isoform X2 [Cydia pomonella]